MLLHVVSSGPDTESFDTYRNMELFNYRSRYIQTLKMQLKEHVLAICRKYKFLISRFFSLSIALLWGHVTLCTSNRVYWLSSSLHLLITFVIVFLKIDTVYHPEPWSRVSGRWTEGAPQLQDHIRVFTVLRTFSRRRTTAAHNTRDRHNNSQWTHYCCVVFCISCKSVDSLFLFRISRSKFKYV